MNTGAKDQFAFLTILCVLYMIAGAGGAIIAVKPPAGYEPHMLMTIPCILLFVFALSMMNRQRMGFYGLLVTKFVLIVSLTVIIRDPGAGGDPLELGAVVLTTPTTWLLLASILMLVLAVKPIEDQLG